MTDWIDGPNRREINLAMSEAREAFDRAYHKSPTNQRLALNCNKAAQALRRAAELTKTNQEN